ncbi:MAG: carboxypeptidase regulatory-like domain-containing protein [Chloroflexi bacterium]|nr:carboxypeptidase regulatory-like domain-containing protein [Chloroflexota bacterium]
MQDKAYAVAIVVVLGICCLGMYVAVSGYFNSNPSALSSLATPVFQSTQVVVNLPTDTPLPSVTLATQPTVATVAPLPSPLGAFQTITAATTAVAPTAPPVTVRPAASRTSTSTSANVSCAGFQFCPKGGLGDSTIAPTGVECPRNFIWGRVTDSNGAGIPNVRVRFKLATTGEADTVTTKGAPDPAGIYNIPTGQPGSSWVLWMLDAGGNIASPQITLVTQVYTGAGNCPTRLDFVQQK